MTFFQIFIGVLRWRIVSAECDAPLPLRQAMRYNVIGAFFNQTLPSSIGGDAVRLWLVARSGAGWRAATYSIFVDRAVGLIALAIVIVASLPWSYHLIADAYGRSALTLLDLAALAGGARLSHARHAALAVAEAVVGDPSHSCLRRNRQPGHFQRERMNRRSRSFRFLVHFLAVVIAWCVVQSIAAPVEFDQTFLLIPPVMLITMLPISIAGWGVREATMGLAFGYAGLVTSEGHQRLAALRRGHR